MRPRPHEPSGFKKVLTHPQSAKMPRRHSATSKDSLQSHLGPWFSSPRKVEGSWGSLPVFFVTVRHGTSNTFVVNTGSFMAMMLIYRSLVETLDDLWLSLGLYLASWLDGIREVAFRKLTWRICKNKNRVCKKTATKNQSCPLKRDLGGGWTNPLEKTWVKSDHFLR